MPSNKGPLALEIGGFLYGVVYTATSDKRAKRGGVTSGHYLATAAGFRIMEQGGNAIDAAAAMCFCLNLLEPQSCGLEGEVLTLIHSAEEEKTYAVSGMGCSLLSFTIDWCRENGIDLIPGDGYLPMCVPAVVDTWALAVARWGKLTFSQVLQPAIDLAEGGFVVYDGLHNALRGGVTKFTELYPSTGGVYLPGGSPPASGELIRNPDWANALKAMAMRRLQTVVGERRASGRHGTSSIWVRSRRRSSSLSHRIL